MSAASRTSRAHGSSRRAGKADMGMAAERNSRTGVSCILRDYGGDELHAVVRSGSVTIKSGR